MRHVGYSVPRMVIALAAMTSFAVPLLAAEPGETRLTVQPMPAPRPAMRYQLLPEVGELNVGNAAQWYLRCFSEQRLFFFSKQGVEERAQLLTMPLKDIPVEKYKQFGGNALRQADWAARLDSIDWQLIHRLQSDDVEPTQPELAALHALALSLQARFRVEIATKSYDDAICTAKTLFAFARHLGENPTEPGSRLGLTVADLALDSLEEMIQQPDCPNLYWALANLPCALVDLHKGIQGSGILMTRRLKSIRDDSIMSDEEIEKIISKLSGMLGFAREEAGKPPRNLRAALATRARDAEQIRAIRKRLLEGGVAEGLVPSFSPLQVLLIEAKRDYETRRDERVKLLAFFPWQIDALNDAERGTMAGGLFDDFLPPVLELRRQQGRFEQRLALLRLVEALRMYAANHGGKWPATLAELAVPMSNDPFTGKAFPYEVKGNIALLRGNPPRGEQTNPLFNIRFAVAVRK